MTALDELVAIDVHTHVLASVDGAAAAADSPAAAVGQVFGRSQRLSLPQLADYYRERRMRCVTFTVDKAREPAPAVTNEEILELAREHADVVIPFASVDPARGAEGARMARRLIADHEVRGFKFHPSSQGFNPGDREAYRLYEVIAEHRLPALFHSGHTAVGSGQPGGGGIRLEHSNPMHLDAVAVDFPEMPIIIAHPSFPWQDEAISVAMHKPQVYIDLSGWAPKYFPPQLVQYANTLLKRKVMFGTDFPVLTPERWLDEFARLPIKDEVRPLILKENAAALLDLEAGP